LIRFVPAPAGAGVDDISPLCARGRGFIHARGLAESPKKSPASRGFFVGGGRRWSCPLHAKVI